MFAKKIPTLFISRNFVEPGVVTLSHAPRFEGSEALPYTEETLPSVLSRIVFIQGKKVRVVLSEDLVYVTVVYVPAGTKLTREQVRIKAEETIPENLSLADWDFRTMYYVEVSETEKNMAVQVAVMERKFAMAFEKALSTQSFILESVMPESCVLAAFEAHEKGLSVIVEQDRENSLLVACEGGLVLMTQVKSGELAASDIARFLSFLSERDSRNVERLFFSHGASADSFEVVKQAGIVYEERSYNPLLGVAYEKVSGRDATVLNLNIFPGREKKSWWQKIFRKDADGPDINS